MSNKKGSHNETLVMAKDRYNQLKYKEQFTQENIEYYNKLGFTFNAREVHAFAGITTYFTSWWFGINPEKRTYNNGVMCEVGFLEYFHLEAGKDYVLLVNYQHKWAGVPQLELLITRRTAELALLNAPKTKAQAIENLIALFKKLEAIHNKRISNNNNNLHLLQ